MYSEVLPGKSAMVQEMAWRRIGNNLVPEPMMAPFYKAMHVHGITKVQWVNITKEGNKFWNVSRYHWLSWFSVA